MKLALILVSLLLVGCSSINCEKIRGKDFSKCPALTEEDYLVNRCDPRTEAQRGCCCGSGLPPCD